LQGADDVAVSKGLIDLIPELQTLAEQLLKIGGGCRLRVSCGEPPEAIASANRSKAR
jgi:hypothetical protein